LKLLTLFFLQLICFLDLSVVKTQESSSGSVSFFINRAAHGATQNEKSGTVRQCRNMITE